MNILRFLAPVQVVRYTGGILSHEGCLGCMSSLVSLTLDEEANPADYPEEWARVNLLCRGAHAIAERLKDNYEEILVFNGRLASIRPVSRLDGGEGSPRVQIYEWGPKGGTFYLDRYPWHDPARVSAELARFAVDSDFRFSAHGAERFKRLKLWNRYVDGRSEPSPHEYRTVVFAGSQHEYRWALDEGEYLDASLSSLLEAAVSQPSFSTPAALKLHPNSAVSKFASKNEQIAADLCRSHGLDLIGSSSQIDPRELILNAETVMVGASTVGLDAFLLGREPVFLGPNPYKGLVELLIGRFGMNEEVSIRAAGIADAFYESKVVVMRPGLRLVGELYRKWIKYYRGLKTRFGLRGTRAR